LLMNVKRVLKHEGLLFITTPNSSSFFSIYKSLNYEDGFIYNRHVKEYSPKQIAQKISQHQFDVNVNTIDLFCPDIVDVDVYSKFIEGIRAMSIFDHEARGDTIFILGVCRKPVER
jgi:hypothetical protein